MINYNHVNILRMGFVDSGAGASDLVWTKRIEFKQ